MPSETQQQQPASSNLAVVLLLAASLLWCIYWFVHARGYWEDDAYIHLEFARSVAAGRGFAFNGHVVAGDTAPLWVFLLAAMHLLIPNWLAAGKAFTVLGAIVGLSGMYAFARNLAASLLPPPVAKVFPAAMLFLVVVNPYSCYWLFSGMESITAAGIACFAVLAATRKVPTAKSFLAGCLLAGLAPLLRPEMIFLTVLLALPLLAQWRRLPVSSAKPAVFVAGFVLLCAPVALWSIYSLHAFGHILPNTNAAKRAAPSDSIVKKLASIYSFGFPTIVAGLLAGIVCLTLRPSAARVSIRNAFTSTEPNSSTLPLAGWIFILWPSIAAIFYIANHTYVQTRYILVTAPGLTIVVMALALKSSRVAGRLLYLAAVVWALVVSVIIVRPFIRNKALNCRANDAIALFIRDSLPPDAPVGSYAIGQIAFVSEHPIVDTGGITRPGAIPYLYDQLPVMARWAQSEGAQYYIEGKPPLPGSQAVFTASMPFIGWTFHTASYSSSDQLSLWKLPPPSEPAPARQTSIRTNP